jgi:S1-C subfamily serine protease
MMVAYARRNLLPLVIAMLATLGIVAAAALLLDRTLASSAPAVVIAASELQRPGALPLMDPLGHTLLMRTGAILGVTVDDSLVVTSVVPMSPADLARIREGDRIIEVGGRSVSTFAELRAALEAVALGTEYTVTVQREGNTVTVKAQRSFLVPPLDAPARAPTTPRSGQPATGDAVAPSVPVQRHGVLLGVSVVQVSAGLRVVAVLPDSPAEAAALVRGDVIASVDGEPVRRFGDLQAALDAAVPGATVLLEVVRAGESLQVEATLATE